jgi:SH3-like domain-containing protein
VACVLFFVYINSTKLLVKRISFSFAAVLAIMFFATYFLGYSSLNSKKENKYAVVLIKEVKIMNEPTPSANSKFSLHEGTKIKLIENNGNWLLIKLDNGNEGWVKTTDVGVI